MGEAYRQVGAVGGSDVGQELSCAYPLKVGDVTYQLVAMARTLDRTRCWFGIFNQENRLLAIIQRSGRAVVKGTSIEFGELDPAVMAKVTEYLTGG